MTESKQNDDWQSQQQSNHLEIPVAGKIVNPPETSLTLAGNRWLRLATLCALYVAQGIPFGFVTITLVAYLSDQMTGAGEAQKLAVVGKITALSILPWSFKWLWGPVIDRFTFASLGRRRPWIIIAQLLMTATMGILIFFPDLLTDVSPIRVSVPWMQNCIAAAGLSMLGLIVFVHNVFCALQDVAVDALAVDLLQEHERGTANGLMYGSKYFGTFLGGAGMGMITLKFGMQTALVLLAIMLFPLLLLERAGEKLFPWSTGKSMSGRHKHETGSILGLMLSLLRAFTLRSTMFGAVLALGVNVGVGVLAVAFIVFSKDAFGFDREQFYMIAGGLVILFGMGGSIGGGFLADLIGARLLAAIATCLLGASWIIFAVLLQPLWLNMYFVTGFLLLEVLLSSVMTVSLFALYMSISWPTVAATQFTAYMALLNLSTAIGSYVAALLIEVVSLPTIYVLCGILQVALLMVIVLIDPCETRRVLGDELEEETGESILP